jgi:hypothetical protein
MSLGFEITATEKFPVNHVSTGTLAPRQIAGFPRGSGNISWIIFFLLRNCLAPFLCRWNGVFSDGNAMRCFDRNKLNPDAINLHTCWQGKYPDVYLKAFHTSDKF